MSGRVKSEDKPIEDGFTNAFWNILTPYTAGGKAVMGAASYVAIETAVSQAVRRVMGAPMNLGESIETHTYSVPFLGMMNFGDPYKALPSEKEEKVDVMDQAQEGAKEIPAATVGYVAMKIRREGLKVPGFGRDFVYLAAGKVLSRILKAYVARSLPNDVQAGLAVVNIIAAKQQMVILAADKGKDI